MNDLNSTLKSATADGDVMTKVDDAHGRYKDAVADSSNMMSKLPQSNMPTAPDPSPFTLGPLGGK